MKSKKVKELVAKGMVNVAVLQARRAVGKSTVMGMHEVEVPDALKKQTKA